MLRLRLILLLGLLVPANAALAAEASDQSLAPAKLDQKVAQQLSRSAIGRQMGDYTLLDRNGRPVKLSSYRGKPLLVSFVYTGCSEVCPATTQFLAKAVKIMQSALGADSFAVVSVGFNAPWDTPQAMRDFAARLNAELPNWEFLSPDIDTAKKLTRDLGFSYAYSVRGFDHISQLTIIDQNGQVHGQVYGDNFDLPLLGEPLKKLVGRVQTQYPGWEGLRNRIRLFCTTYDIQTGTYRTDYTYVVGLIFSLIMILAIIRWILREARRAWSPTKEAPTA